VGCLWWALTSAWRALQFCTGSYYNALFMGLRGCCTSSLIGFSDTSLFFSFLFLDGTLLYPCAIFMVPCGYGIFPRFHFAFGSVAKLRVKEPLIAFWAWGTQNEWRVCKVEFIKLIRQKLEWELQTTLR
jgi:hypothetical protein